MAQMTNDDESLIDSRVIKSTFYEDFKKLRESEELTDISLKYGDEIIKCHKAILSARSPKFRFIVGVD